jgi:hypothetical protein
MMMHKGKLFFREGFLLVSIQNRGCLLVTYMVNRKMINLRCVIDRVGSWYLCNSHILSIKSHPKTTNPIQNPYTTAQLYYSHLQALRLLPYLLNYCHINYS